MSSPVYAKQVFIEYLKLKIELEDWHAVWDVAHDLKELQLKRDLELQLQRDLDPLRQG